MGFFVRYNCYLIYPTNDVSEEAENERMHLMTGLQLKNPRWLFRMGVVSTQGTSEVKNNTKKGLNAHY